MQVLELECEPLDRDYSEIHTSYSSEYSSNDQPFYVSQHSHSLQEECGSYLSDNETKQSSGIYVTQNEDFSKGLNQKGRHRDGDALHETIKATWSTFTDSVSSSSQDFQKTFSNLLGSSSGESTSDGSGNCPQTHNSEPTEGWSSAVLATRSGNSSLTSRSQSSQSKSLQFTEFEGIEDPIDHRSIYSSGSNSWEGTASRNVSLLDTVESRDDSETHRDDEEEEDEERSFTSVSTEFSNVDLNDLGAVMYQIGSCNLRPQGSLISDEDYNDISNILPPVIAQYVGRTSSNQTGSSNSSSSSCSGDDTAEDGTYLTEVSGESLEHLKYARGRGERHTRQKKKRSTHSSRVKESLISSIMRSAFSCGAPAAF